MSVLPSINRNQWKLFGALGAVLLVVGILMASAGNRTPTGGSLELRLNVWGVGLTAAEMQPVLDEFSAAYTRRYGNKLAISYQTWPLEEYEDVLVNRIAEGKGPDVAFVKNTWLLKHYTKLVPLPESFTGYIPRGSEADIGVWTADAYERTFVKTVAKDFLLQGRIYAVPLHVDTLALYYNEDHFRQAQITNSHPGATWDELATQVPSLVRRDPFSGNLRRAAVALGTVKNIRLHVQRADSSLPTPMDNGADLLSLLLLQNGGAYCTEFCTTLAFRDQGTRALETFLRFATPGDSAYTWSPSFTQDLGQQYVDDSVDAFLTGSVSAVFGYSTLHNEILTRSTGQSFNVKVAPVPQLGEERVALASYWGVAVTRGARTKYMEADINQANAQAALELVAYMGRQGPQMALFRSSKRPPAREDLLQRAATEDPVLAPLIRQVQIAETAQVYDEAQLKKAIADAFELHPAARQGAATSIERLISEAVQRMTLSSSGRTPPPPPPTTPPGVRR